MSSQELYASQAVEALGVSQAFAARALAKAAEGQDAGQAAKVLAPLVGLTKGQVKALILFARNYPQWEPDGNPVYPVVLGEIIRRTEGNPDVRETLLRSYTEEFWTENQVRAFTKATRRKESIDELEYLSRKQLVESRGIPNPEEIEVMPDIDRREMVLNLRKLASKINYQEAQ